MDFKCFFGDSLSLNGFEGLSAGEERPESSDQITGYYKALMLCAASARAAARAGQPWRGTKYGLSSVIQVGRG